MHNTFTAALLPISQLQNGSQQHRKTPAHHEANAPSCLPRGTRHFPLFIATVATIALVTLAPTAHAQSVTLYGVLDQGLDFTNNAGKGQAWKVQSADLQGERWGLTGSEGLGGNLSAVFRLENGFDSSSGSFQQGGRMFGRQAYVGLSDTRFGTLTIGRQYDSLVDTVAPLTANGGWGGGPFSHPFDNDNTSNSFRLNNAIKYASINFNGVSFTGTYALSNQAGGFAENNEYSLGAQYQRGPLTGAIAYLDARHPGMTPGGALPSDNTTFVAQRQRIWGAGINYLIGKANVGLVYTHTSINHPSSVAGIGDLGDTTNGLKFDNIELNTQYHFRPDLYAGVMYTFTEGSVAENAKRAHPKWHQAGAILDYALSKRTDIYAQLAYQKVLGDDTGTLFDRADISGAADFSSSNTQVFARLGVRHLF